MTEQATPVRCQRREVEAMIAAVMRGAASDLAGHFLLGSRARGGHRPRSDFDVDVAGEVALPAEVYFSFEGRLASRDVENAGCIQSFEFGFEPAWNIICDASHVDAARRALEISTELPDSFSALQSHKDRLVEVGQ